MEQDREVAMNIDDLFPGFKQSVIDDAVSAGCFTLGMCIRALQDLPPETPLATPCGELLSYRGYYDHLAIQPTGDIDTAGKLLAECNRADGRVYEGYKGGDYRMGLETPVWFSEWGTTGPAVSGFRVVGGKLVIDTKEID